MEKIQRPHPPTLVISSIGQERSPRLTHWTTDRRQITYNVCPFRATHSSETIVVVRSPTSVIVWMRRPPHHLRILFTNDPSLARLWLRLIWLLRRNVSESMLPGLSAYITSFLMHWRVASCTNKCHNCVTFCWYLGEMSEKKPLFKPLLKKTSLDPNILKNFRPVSNISFVSKLLKKIVLSQLLAHLDHNNLWHDFQSAYRPNHCIETALLRVLNDLLSAGDTDHISILTLLHLSVTFDTIHHDLFLYRLKHVFKATDVALSFFKSYLEDREQVATLLGYASVSYSLCLRAPYLTALAFFSVQFSSVQFKMVSMRSGRPICAPPRLSGVSPMLPLKQFQCWFDWRWPFIVLSKKIFERFLFLRLSPPGDQWCDFLGFVPAGNLFSTPSLSLI